MDPAPDFLVELRPGDNLYTDSLVALDATSGRMLAYNQLVKHDFHDWDVSDSGAIFTSRAGRKLIDPPDTANGWLTAYHAESGREV
jgi:alcohol dehydrogenase (cytochrome c)